MKNLLKFSTFLLAVVILFQVSCDEDDAPAPVDDLVGKWALSGATFLATNVDPTDLMSITNFPTASGTVTAQFPANTDITTLVIGAMADSVCTSTANYATFFLELNAAGELYLNCPAESNSELSGTWVKTEDPTLGTVITLNINAAGTTLPISFTEFAMLGDKSKFSGQAQGFPMVTDFSMDLGPTNLQFMTADMEFTRLP